MLKKVMVGIDEVGRGPLAGPITVAAAAVFRSPKHKIQISKVLSGIKDSKKLSAKQRGEWFEKLKEPPYIKFTVASVGPRVIDKIGITAAARLAVGRCLSKLVKNYKLKAKDTVVLLDGSLYAPEVYLNQKTIIKGDSKIPLIAAASIVAKVRRDRGMEKMHTRYIKYGFARHKGYGTRAHMAAIRRHGLCPIHRRSFCTRIV